MSHNHESTLLWWYLSYYQDKSLEKYLKSTELWVCQRLHVILAYKTRHAPNEQTCTLQIYLMHNFTIFLYNIYEVSTIRGFYSYFTDCQYKKAIWLCNILYIIMNYCVLYELVYRCAKHNSLTIYSCKLLCNMMNKNFCCKHKTNKSTNPYEAKYIYILKHKTRNQGLKAHLRYMYLSSCMTLNLNDEDPWEEDVLCRE